MRLRAFIFGFLFLVTHSVFSQTARQIAASLDDSALAAQVLLAGIDGKGSLTPAMRSILERVPAGGIMLFRYNLDSSKADVQRLLAETSALVSRNTGIPPFMAVDHEGGDVHRFGPGITRLPSAFSFWEMSLRESRAAALASAENQYRSSAAEIRELGINMVLGPVAESLNYDNRAFLDTRSYGPDLAFTQAAASAFVRSMDAAGIASVVKHFPGNSAADPHTGASVLGNSRAELNEMVRPFAGVIRDVSPAAIMVSHVMVPAIDSQRNASLSPAVIQGWLRGELGFNGIVIADDFSMAAITAAGFSPNAAAIEALNAGADMIMVWPSSLVSLHGAIFDALRSGRLSRNRLVEAATRIIEGKIRYGLVSK